MNATQDTVNWLAGIAYDASGRLSDEIIQACRASGGRGCSRTVWLCGDVAYKFDNGSALHHESNQIEWNLYQQVDETVADMMAKPLAISDDGNVLAMERMEGVLDKSDFAPVERHKLQREFNAKLSSNLSDSGFSMCEIDNLTHDNHGDNLAFDSNGDLKWIDYGSDRAHRSSW